jgi:hypothetical protein
MSLDISMKSVIRVSLANFDPSRLAQIERMVRNTGDYLIPKIKELPGLTGYFAGASPTGSMVHVSLWDSDAHANQMGQLKEMVVNARQDAEAIGVQFIPIVNYPVSWHI